MTNFELIIESARKKLCDKVFASGKITVKDIAKAFGFNEDCLIEACKSIFLVVPEEFVFSKEGLTSMVNYICDRILELEVVTCYIIATEYKVAINKLTNGGRDDEPASDKEYLYRLWQERRYISLNDIALALNINIKTRNLNTGLLLTDGLKSTKDEFYDFLDTLKLLNEAIGHVTEFQVTSIFRNRFKHDIDSNVRKNTTVKVMIGWAVGGNYFVASELVITDPKIDRDALANVLENSGYNGIKNGVVWTAVNKIRYSDMFYESVYVRKQVCVKIIDEEDLTKTFKGVTVDYPYSLFTNEVFLDDPTQTLINIIKRNRQEGYDQLFQSRYTNWLIIAPEQDGGLPVVVGEEENYYMAKIVTEALRKLNVDGVNLSFAVIVPDDLEYDFINHDDVCTLLHCYRVDDAIAKAVKKGENSK